VTGSLTQEEVQFLLDVVDLARGGRTDELEPLLNAGVPVNLTNGAGDSLLILAAYHRHPGTVSMLLAHGADTERENDRGQTALGAAVFRQSAEMVSMLLAAGADPAGGPRSALELAEFFGLNDMAELLSPAK
jgi:ankyrin repeat protein